MEDQDGSGTAFFFSGGVFSAIAPITDFSTCTFFCHFIHK